MNAKSRTPATTLPLGGKLRRPQTKGGHGRPQAPELLGKRPYLPQHLIGRELEGEGVSRPLCGLHTQLHWSLF